MSCLVRGHEKRGGSRESLHALEIEPEAGSNFTFLKQTLAISQKGEVTNG